MSRDAIGVLQQARDSNALQLPKVWRAPVSFDTLQAVPGFV